MGCHLSTQLKYEMCNFHLIQNCQVNSNVLEEAMAIASQLIKVVVQNENSRRKYAPMHKCTNLIP